MDLTKFVEHHNGISVIRGGEKVRSWNGIEYQAGLSAKNVNVKHLSMNVATVPPGGVAYAHVHVGFEVMLYILSGRVRHEFGDKLDAVRGKRRGRFHLHRARRSARGVQPQRHRAGRRRRRAFRRGRVGAHRRLRSRDGRHRQRRAV